MNYSTKASFGKMSGRTGREGARPWRIANSLGDYLWRMADARQAGSKIVPFVQGTNRVGFLDSRWLNSDGNVEFEDEAWVALRLDLPLDASGSVDLVWVAAQDLTFACKRIGVEALDIQMALSDVANDLTDWAKLHGQPEVVALPEGLAETDVTDLVYLMIANNTGESWQNVRSTLASISDGSFMADGLLAQANETSDPIMAQYLRQRAQDLRNELDPEVHAALARALNNREGSGGWAPYLQNEVGRPSEAERRHHMSRGQNNGPFDDYNNMPASRDLGPNVSYDGRVVRTLKNNDNYFDESAKPPTLFVPAPEQDAVSTKEQKIAELRRQLAELEK